MGIPVLNTGNSGARGVVPGATMHAEIRREPVQLPDGA
jgi:hypothetical protein